MSANAAAAAGVLIPRRGRGWRMGLANMLGKENTAWWRTRRWWTQCLIALFFLNLFLALNLRHGGVSNAVNELPDDCGGRCASCRHHHGPGCHPGGATLRDSRLGALKASPAAGLHPGEADRLWTGLAGDVGRAAGRHCLSRVRGSRQGASADTWLRRGAGAGLPQPHLLPDACADACHAVSGSRPCVGNPALRGVGLDDHPPGCRAGGCHALEAAEYLGQNEAIRALAVYMVQGQPLPTAAPIIATALWCVLFTGVAIWRMGREEF